MWVAPTAGYVFVCYVYNEWMCMEMCSVTDLVNILSLTAVSYHSINNMQELEMQVKEIGDWEALCRQLQLSKTILDSLQSASMNSEAKKTACLVAYLSTGKACWEDVVKVVAAYPFHNNRLARKIADTHGVEYNVVREEL